MKYPLYSIALLCLLLFANPTTAIGQERPNPGPAPSYVPDSPPSLAEVSPFPSNTDNQIAVIAHLFDPKRNRLIISIDTQSNQNFVLQKSGDLLNWTEDVEMKQGNKSVITFFVPLEKSTERSFFRIIKR